MSNKKRKIESPANAGKKAKLEEKPSTPDHSAKPLVRVPCEPASSSAESKKLSAESKKLSKKKEKRKLFKKENKKKLLKEGKLSRVAKKKKKPKMEGTSVEAGETTTTTTTTTTSTSTTTTTSTSTTITTTTTSTPPKKPEDISANWKALQQVLQKENGTSKKKKKNMKKFALLKKEKAFAVATAKPDKEPEVKPMPKPEIWFEIDDEKLLEHSVVEDVEKSESVSSDKELGLPSGPRKDAPTGLTDIVGLDCEMVGVGEGGVDSILARISIVNQHGHPVYDKYVKPTETVTDYRTEFSGIRPHNLREGAVSFKTAQSEVADILKNRILVGHSLSNDLQVLFLSHHRKKIRDTQKYKPFKKLCGGMPSLKKLAAAVLNVSVQSGEHSSVEDAQTAMRLYMMHRSDWEKEMREKRKKGVAKKKTDDA